MHAHEVRGIVRFLYTHNPFYLLSTGLILYGLQAAFGSLDSLDESPRAWGLVGALFGYTALMAVTGCLIVRLGGVWQDARSIVLILLLLFVAISTSFDQICNTSPSTATSVLLAGLCATGLISEFVLRGLRIRFPWPYRLPYYALLSLFFLYPLWASTEITGASPDVVSWRVFLFPTVCGLVSLLLIPAIRQTSRYVKDNGTPWHWPWFPWSVFVFLAVGVCGRAIALTYSFVPMREWNTPFGLYFLAPFVAAIVVLVFEIALTERLPRLACGTLWVAPVLLFLSRTPLGSPAYEDFVSRVTVTLGSPLWMGTLMLGAFYVYAWCRGQRSAELGLAATLLFASWVSPQTRVFFQAAESHPQWLPLVMLGAWQLVAGLAYHTSFRTLVASLCLVVGLSLRWHDTSFVAMGHVAPIHLSLAALIFTACWFEDDFARFLRRVAALGLLGAGGWAVFALASAVPFWAASMYAGLLALLAVALWYRSRESFWLLSAIGNMLHATAAHVMAAWFAAHEQLGPNAAVSLAVGIACFFIAASISAWKGGIGVTMERWWRQALKWHSEPS